MPRMPKIVEEFELLNELADAEDDDAELDCFKKNFLWELSETQCRILTMNRE